jgi:NAD-dependent DNA ligase
MVKNITKKIRNPRETKVKDKKIKEPKTKKKRKLKIASTSTEIIPSPQNKLEKSNNIDLKIVTDDNKMHNDSAEHNESNKSIRLNEKFIDLMEQLSSIMLKQGEPFRARAYQKAQETIMAYPGDILSPDDLKGKPNIGSTIMEKLNEYYSTGTLKVLEREKNNPINILSEVYGIGPKKAKELVDKGITSIDELQNKQDEVLNETQKVGLQYYGDILQRIPRSEIEEYKSIFVELISTSDTKMEIVGSYRRGAESSGDIDVIITSSNPMIFKKFIDDLISKGIIKEVLSRGQTKCLVITKLPHVSTSRRVDFLYTSLEEFPFAILYFTGSKIFNTVMRHEALAKGLTMNEHGLYLLTNNPNNKKGTKGEKVDHIFTSEKDIFDYLGLEYKEPHERTDGRAIIKVSKITAEKKAPTPTPEKKASSKTKSKSKEVTDVNETEENIVELEINEDTKTLINHFKKNGIGFLGTLNESQLTDMLNLANVLYRNFQPIMTDNEYDILEDYIKEKYPSNQDTRKIGAPVEKNKVTLPYHMASMDKIKPDTNALTNWIKKYTGPYVLSCKLDGVSGLYTTEGKTPKLYTRGDGTVGQDISHLIPYLRLPKTKGVVIRGEFIIPKVIFETKYKTKFANPRNLVAGIINHKTVSETARDIHFVSYEVIKPVLKPSEQMDFLGTLDIERVLSKNETKSTLTNELLSDTLIEWRESYTYEIDGVIVIDDKIYPRKPGNPEYAFAFKMVLSDQIAEAKVVDIIWTPSKDGYLKPRVQIEPINLGGVRIEYATGFNGAFINDNKVGIGAIIELIRSGDVIPHIRKVTVPAEESKMPSVPFKWNDTHVDVLLEDIQSDETVKEKVITGFFRGIGVEGLSSGNISRIVQTGFDSVPKIIKMSIPDFLTVEGFKEKMASKLYNGIKDKLTNASLVTIMSASNLFGRGFSEKKLELIMESYPDVLLSKESNTEKVRKIAAIKGMAQKTAEAFVERIPNFIEFIQEAKLNNKLSQLATQIQKQQIDETHPLFGKTIVMTGFRDTDIQEALKNVGAKLGSSVSKNTFVVLVKDLSEDTGKAADARRLGVPLMTPEVFKEKYL